jgi:hypothetical protein
MSPRVFEHGQVLCEYTLTSNQQESSWSGKQHHHHNDFILTHTKFSKSFLQNKFKNTKNKNKQLINSLLKNDYMLFHSVYLPMECSTLVTLTMTF